MKTFDDCWNEYVEESGLVGYPSLRYLKMVAQDFYDRGIKFSLETFNEAVRKSNEKLRTEA